MVHLNRATCSTLFLNADMAMVWPILTSALARGELPSQFFKQEIVFLYGKQKHLSKQKLPRNQEPTQMAWNMRPYSTRTLHSKGCAVSTCNRWAYVLYIYIYIYAYIHTHIYIYYTQIYIYIIHIYIYVYTILYTGSYEWHFRVQLIASCKRLAETGCVGRSAVPWRPRAQTIQYFQA